MKYLNFRHYLRKNATGEVLQHAKRRKFPASDEHRTLREYVNSKYRGEFLSNRLIKGFENHLDEYEALKVGGNNG
jgi:hypothetical protein